MMSQRTVGNAPHRCTWHTPCLLIPFGLTIVTLAINLNSPRSPKLIFLIDECTNSRLIIHTHHSNFQTDISRSTAMIMYVYLDPDLFDFSKMYLIILLLSTIKVMKSPHDLLLLGLRFCRIVAINLQILGPHQKIRLHFYGITENRTASLLQTPTIRLAQLTSITFPGHYHYLTHQVLLQHLNNIVYSFPINEDADDSQFHMSSI